MKEKFKKEDMLENESEIVEQAKKDDQAFEILYNFYFPKIYRYIHKRVGSFEVAEDLVSNTFLKVFTNLDSYKDRGFSFGAWVYKIATNNLIDYYRKSKKIKKINIDNIKELKDETNKMPEEIMHSEQERELIRRVLKELPEKHQRIIYLKFFAEKGNDEIAEILETNTNNVRILIFRALRNFKEAYQRYEK